MNSVDMEQIIHERAEERARLALDKALREAGY